MMNKNCRICLHSMVGNEEHVIERMLNSCYQYIDYWVVQCNGNDKTQEIIEKFFQEKNIPGFTYNFEWNYPGYNRDHALQVLLKSDHNCDWILRMDADEQLSIDETFDWEILNDLNVQSWNVTAYSPGSYYFRTWLWNAKLPWTFRHDKRHECILLPGCGETGEEFQRESLPSSFKHIITNDGETWVDPNKFLVDALELEKNQISQGTLLSDTYHLFYIGKSYNDCYEGKSFPFGYDHQVEFARRCIFYLEKYTQIVSQGEMVYYSYYLIGNAYKFCKDYEKAIVAYRESEKYCPIRNEHLCGLAETYMELGDYETMFLYTSQLISDDRKNPFPSVCFLLHNCAYPDTGDYVQHLHSIAIENLNYSNNNSSMSIVYNNIRNYVDGIDSSLLKNPEFIENIFLIDLGLNDEALEEQPPELGQYYGKGFGLKIWQYPNQFSKYLTFISNYDIKSYMEIGCRHGGTFITHVEYLKKINSNFSNSTAVDIIEQTDILKEYCKFENCEYLQMDSSSDEFRQYIENKFFDLIFVDGNHFYNGVKGDAILTKNKCNIQVFHDVFSIVNPDVVRFWNEVKITYSDTHDFYEFLDQYDSVSGDYLGIGVAVRKMWIS